MIGRTHAFYTYLSQKRVKSTHVYDRHSSVEADFTFSAEVLKDILHEFDRLSLSTAVMDRIQERQPMSSACMSLRFGPT